MAKVLQPLEAAGVSGVEMSNGDGIVHRCHPLLAVFIGDFPEQCLVTGTKHCPMCPTQKDELREDESLPIRDLPPVLEALSAVDEWPAVYSEACLAAGIKPIIHPFWENLPYVNIFQSITPDILHQLYQGVIKHIVSWVTETFGSAEIDARCRRLPPNHNVRIFLKGITTLSRVSGKEHADMCKILLGVILDMRTLHGTPAAQVVHAVRGILDFLYIAQFPVQSEETLDLLVSSLSVFHENKAVFKELGIRDNFNIPKFHSMQHYVMSIRNYGTTDNYNTEYTERLHIDLTKDAYNSTNFKDEFTQMTLWLERKEKVIRHGTFITWRLSGQPTPLPPVTRQPHIQMTRQCSKTVSFTRLVSNYGAKNFYEALQMAIARYQHPFVSQERLNYVAPQIAIPFIAVPVFHKIKFWNQDPYRRPDCSDVLDVAHVRPSQKGKRGQIPERFDTVLVNSEDEVNDVSSIRGLFVRTKLYKVVA
jgi:hypothetical protein